MNITRKWRQVIENEEMRDREKILQTEKMTCPRERKRKGMKSNIGRKKKNG